MVHFAIQGSICDRCGNREEFTQHNLGYDWGKVAFMQANGPIKTHHAWPTAPNLALDLCPKCLKELYDWSEKK